MLYFFGVNKFQQIAMTSQNLFDRTFAALTLLI